jgi:hypothetical protein
MNATRGSHITYKGRIRTLEGSLKPAVGAAVVMLSVEVPDPFVTVIELGLNTQVARDGSPEQESDTGLLELPCDCTVTVTVGGPGCPALTVTVAGEVAMLKSGSKP